MSNMSATRPRPTLDADICDLLLIPNGQKPDRNLFFFTSKQGKDSMKSRTMFNI